MRTRDIREWIRASDPADAESPYDPDDDMAPGHAAPADASRLDESESDWDAFVAHAAGVLRDTRPKRRNHFVEKTVPLVAEDAETTSLERVELYRLLLAASFFHTNRKARALMVRAGAALLRADVRATREGACESVALQEAVRALGAETQRLTRPGLDYIETRAQWETLRAWVQCAMAAATRGGDAAQLHGSDAFQRLVWMCARLAGTQRQLRLAPGPGLVHAPERAWAADAACMEAELRVALELPAAEAQGAFILQEILCSKLASACADADAARVAPYKGAVLQYYAAHVVPGKMPDVLPAQRVSAFFRRCVTQGDLDAHVLPALQKMLLRAPESAYYHLAALCRHVCVDRAAVLARFQSGLISSLGSANAATREAALRMGDSGLFAQADLASFIDAYCRSIKAGEVRGEEQRASQYALLRCIECSAPNSVAVLTGLAPVLQKETQPASVSAALGGAHTHLAHVLHTHAEVPAAFTHALVGKTASAKAPLRAAALSAVYASVQQERTHVPFWRALLPALRAGIKNAAGALTTPECGVEGSVAAALAWDALGAADADAALRAEAAQIAPLDALYATAPKVSFLLNDKVAHKLAEQGLVHWHANALRATLRHLNVYRLHDDELRAHVLALLRVYVRHGAPRAAAAARGAPGGELCASTLACDTVHAIARGDARLAVRIVRDLLAAEPDLSARVARRLLDVGASGGSTASLADVLVLAHAPQLRGEPDVFVALCRAAHADPHDVVCAHADDLLHLVYAAQGEDVWRGAAEAALTTLMLIAPEAIAGRVCGDLVRDLSVRAVEDASEHDIAVWRAPPDRPYVDVLASKAKGGGGELDRGRASSMDKWDAEVRASIAAKKAARAPPPALSKQDQAAVDAQLAHEREVRAGVEKARVRILHALQRMRPAFYTRAPAMDTHVFDMTVAVRACVESARVRALGLADAAADALATLAAAAAAGDARVHTACGFVRSAMLRDADAALVPLDYALEAGDAVALRALYQLRFLADAAPLGCAACGYVVPWLARLVDCSRMRGDAAHDDAVVERVQLVVDVLAAHAPYGADAAWPRAEVLRTLLAVLRHVPMLMHDAIGALRAYGETIAHAHRGQGALVLQLLDAALSDERRERDGALQCLVPLDLTEHEFPVALWLAMHSDLRDVAAQIWAENALDVPPTYVAALVPLLAHAHAYVRASTPPALGAACALHPGTFAELRDALRMAYDTHHFSLEPEYDQYGMVIESTLHRQDPWQARLAVAHAFRAVAPSFAPADVVPFFAFALAPGVALSDRSEDVRRAMLDAAAALIDAHGAPVLAELLRTLEASIGSGESDAATEAAVVLLGRAARHLPGESEHVRRVVDRLLAALRTPSELVQEAVAACLPALVRTPAVARDVPRIVDGLFVELLHGDTYAARRGAAYGLAGAVRGRGVSALKELRVLARLADAVLDTSTPSVRQGAVFAYETLAQTLQVLLEPYVGGILERLLVCFGDAHADVREATQDAARVLMRSLSGQCLKLILPSLLDALDEKQWRTKKGAVELLGAMAWCAPKQLSAALPAVIPRLSDVLTDSHRQVSAAASHALQQFGEVIHNPEVRALVPTLLKALVDPNAKTAAALKALLRTTFVHYIDAPSLALIAPIIERGLRERTVSLQKQAAQIVGNLASLTDTRDYVPYLAKYTPLVRVVLVSPVPDARGVAAKALGTLVERLGEVHFADLVPSLLHVLQTNATGVDRHGAAQGLAEVLAGLGMERMERLLPSIIARTQDSTSYVREGHLALLIYLPATFGARFVPHLVRIVPPIVASMADDVEAVRDASMRAGRMLIVHYTARAVDLLLPQLEPRLFDARHRVRLAALQLTADMLFRVSGISGQAEVEGDGDGDDEHIDAVAAASSSVQRALSAALGADRRARILASLFILRQDPSIPVRQAAAHTWKALVHNTPRTAREVLPVMLDLLLGGALASDDAEQRDMAGRTLGELVRKLGEKILAETVPLLSERAAHAPSAATRAGVCRAVTDILANATKTQLEHHEHALIHVVRLALGDTSAQVRAAAAHALDAMQSTLGAHAIDATVPTLLAALDDAERAPTALAALREVVRTQPDVVFPVVVPRLAHVPMSDAAAHTLATLLPVAGPALAAQVSAVLGSVAASADESAGHVFFDVADALFAAVQHVDALHQVVLQLLAWLGARQPARQALACDLFVHFAQHMRVPWSDYHVDFVRRFVALYESPHEPVFVAARAALEAGMHAVPKDAWGALVVPLRRALESTGAPGHTLPGLCQPRGASPFVPVLLHGLLQGNAEQREQGALGLADVVEKTSTDAVKPFITAMVGPLIRLCGDRHAPPVKLAILTSLDTMVHAVPMHVRPFYPQLQRSFHKALSDASSASVRTKAAHALGFLMGLQPRVESVVTELIHTLRAAYAAPDDTADAAATALACILQHAPPERLGDSVRADLAACIRDAFAAPDEPREPLKKAIADIVPALLTLDSLAADALLTQHILVPAPLDVHLAALCVRACMEHAPAALFAAARPPALVAQLTAAWLSEAPSVARAAREARDAIRRTPPWSTDAAVASAL